MMDLNKLKMIDRQYVLGTYRRKDVRFVRGDHVYLYDDTGKQYVDFISGIGVANLGHANRHIAEEIAAQAGQLLHVSNLFYTDHAPALAKALCELSGMNKVFFCNSGTEGTEGAIKFARLYGKRNKAGAYKIVSALRSFHGRTLAALTATGQEEKSKPFEPLPPGFVHVPLNDIETLKKAVDPETCGLMLEVVQGEGGVHPCTQEYLQAARKICDETNTLLMIDDVQTGIGRLGHWFGHQHFGIRPDILWIAKGLGNGLPIGAILLTDELAECIKPGEHGSTFGGGPLVTRAALKILEIIELEDILGSVRELGEYFQTTTRDLFDGHRNVVQMRGIGLMQAIELADGLAGKIVDNMLVRGFVLNNTSDHTLRFLPPLVIERSHITEMLNELKDELDKW